MVYVKNSDMQSMCQNFDKLIDVLNHRVTGLEESVRNHTVILAEHSISLKWLMRISAIQASLLGGILLALLGGILGIIL